MSAIPLIVEALQASADVTGLVEGRIYPIRNVQGEEAPHLVVVPLSESDGNVLTGEADSLPEARVAVICRSKAALQVIQLGDAVVKALPGRRTLQGQTVQIVREDIDSAEYLEGQNAFRRTIGFRIHYRG